MYISYEAAATSALGTTVAEDKSYCVNVFQGMGLILKS